MGLTSLKNEHQTIIVRQKSFVFTITFSVTDKNIEILQKKAFLTTIYF